MKEYLNLFRFFNPTGWILLYANALLGLLIGGIFSKTIPVHFFITFAIGAFLIRSAGCVINDILDRKIDAKVERTKNRPLANGKLNLKQALACLFVLLLCSFAVLLTMPKIVIVICSFSLLFIGTYPLFKRFTYFPQVFLGITYGIAFFAGFLAVFPHFKWQIVLIYIALILWTVIFDTIYAMQDVKDDIKIGVKSTAVFFGAKYKQFLHFVNIAYFLFLLIFWHLMKLKWVIFPLISFIFIAFLIKKAEDKTFFLMFKLNFFAIIVVCFGIFLNL
jgi:4-hydroxybenzoate polyprenyltransferase